jgi:translocation and assembly module TamB
MKNGLFRHIRVKRVLLCCVAAAAVSLLLAVCFVAAIPTLVSSPAVQDRLRQTLARSLHRPIAWTRLTMTWSEGLTLSGLSLGDGPPPLLRGRVEEVVLVPAVGRGAKGRWRLDLALRVRTVSLDLAPGPPKPPKPPKPYKEPLTALAEAVQKLERLDFPLPVDVGVRVEVLPVRVAYRDPRSNRSLTVNDLSWRLDMPSLADRPIETELHGELAVDGHRLEPLRLKGRVERLVTAARRIHPAAALVSLDGSMSGGSLKVSGGLLEPGGFALHGGLDLPRLLGALRPLLKPSTPQVAGAVTVDLRAGVGPAKDLQGAMEVKGSGLALWGGRLAKGRLGPLELRLGQKFASDRAQRRVTFSDGSLTVAGLLEAAWRATVERPDRPERTLSAEIGPVRLDLKRAMTMAAPLLPPKMPVREVTGELTLRRLTARLNGRNNEGDLLLEGLGLTLPRLRLRLAQGEVAADGIALVVERAAVPLAAMKPTRLDAEVSYGIQQAAVAGPRPVAAERLRGNLRLALSDLDLKSPSPRRVSAAAELTQALDLGRLQVEKTVTVVDLHQELGLSASAGKSGEIAATLRELKITAPSIQANAAGKTLRPLSFIASITAEGIRVPAGKGARPTLERASLELAAGDLLKVSAKASLPAASPQVAASEGRGTVDLGRLLPFAAPFFPKGVAAGGNVSLAWDMAANLGKLPLAKERNPFRLAREAAAMVERGEASLAIDAARIAVPLKNGKVELATLRTPRPLSLLLAGKGGSIRVDGGMEFTGLAGLPGKAGELPPQSGSLLVKGELADWRSLHLQDELRIQPLNISQSAEATVGRLDALLDEQGAIAPATLLKRLDAALSARVEARFPERPAPLPGGVELAGDCSAALHANLTAGSELRLRARLEARELGARLANGTTVEGVRADLLVDRTFALSQARAGGAKWTPLSVSLVRPLPEQRGIVGGAEIAGRVRDDLGGEELGSRRFTIRRVAARAGGIPVELTSLSGELLLTPERVGLGFFQAELLGGTIRSRGVIDLRPGLPALSAACSFSNLEAALLLPAEVRGKGAAERGATEMSGEVNFEAPLATGERELVEGLRLRLNLHKIGPATLERALFSLDPYERNEQVVAQRKMLRLGSLKRLNGTLLDGSFGLEGEVQVKGVDLALPKVERIRLAELAKGKQLARGVAAVATLRRVLELARADTLLVGPKGEISLKYSGVKAEE